VQPGTGENVAFLRGSGTEKLQVDATEKASRFPSCHGATEPDLSFKECIQAYAMEKGLLFMPRVGRFYNGMPRVKRVVYAQLRQGIKRWSAVSLRQLVEMNWVGRTC
jgi:tuftelin-interacting protein 11